MISRRARFAPRQWCAPGPPKPTCSFGVRVTSKRYGSAKTASSRFAELYQSTIFSPARSFWPPSSVSCVAVRRKWITGDAQRTISSTAVGATPSKSAAHLRRSAGWSESAFMPWLIALRVVSLPAATSSTKNDASSWSVSVWPSIWAFRSCAVRSSFGFARRSLPISFISSTSARPALSAAMIGFAPGATYSGSPRPRMMFVWSKTNCVWLSGMPIMSQMIPSGSGAAIFATKSHSPWSITASTSALARRSTSCCRRPSARGVKPRDTMPRSRAWRGSSIAIIEPKNSFISAGRSGMLMPLPEQNRSERRLAVTTSAWRVTAQ